MGDEPAPNRQSSTNRARLRRHLPGGGENGQVLGLPEDVRRVIRVFHSLMDCDATRLLPVLDN